MPIMPLDDDYRKKRMKHLDLFSGIGGFAYAADQVWDNVEHIFCDNDKFCQQVLKKHWPESYIYDDIRSITADSNISRYLQRQPEEQPAKRPHQAQRKPEPSLRPSGIQLLTGGFPCQPFSAAGLRRGTADERHLWPEMLRVIKLTQPSWVIAENVRGILTWNEGLVFEQVCTELEAAGYSVWSIIIPAVAVNAPHRRDRVWFIGHSNSSKLHRKKRGSPTTQGQQTPSDRSQDNASRQSSRADERLSENGQPDRYDKPTADTRRSSEGNESKPKQPSDNIARQNRQDDTHSASEGLERGEWSKLWPGHHAESYRNRGNQRRNWSENWLEVATELCSVDDGLPAELGDFSLTKAGHRKEQLKAYGNAIVPQVAIEIMKGISL